MKKIIFLFSLSTIAVLIFSFTYSDPILDNILKKLEAFNLAKPQEKIYLHLDKPVYRAGDNIWLKGYLTEASQHIPDSSSRIVYVELMDSAHSLIGREILFVIDGNVFGDFILPDTLAEGLYIIRAYTNHMKNIGEDFFFNRQIQIINARNRNTSAATIVKGKPDLQFFPEGGNLVACGQYNRVAFKAIGPNGQGMSVSGNIVDENNTVVATFSSVHNGLGSLNLKPKTGSTYVAHITSPYEVSYPYPLPKVQDKGYVLRVDRSGSNLKVIVFINNAEMQAQPAIRLVVQSGGKVYHAIQGTMTKDGFTTLINRNELPDGVSQITIFDNDGRPVAERLIFEDRDGALSMTVKTDSAQYARRSRVTLTLNSAYFDNVAASGNFSVTVYNEDQAINPEQFPLTIGSYMSLASDLKGHIENPGYYVKDTLPETRFHRDLLLMTQGWRRFTWNDVLLPPDSFPALYSYEQGIVVSGSIFKSRTKKTPASALLKIMTMKGDIVMIEPDSLGNFVTDQFIYYDSTTLIFQAENEKGKQQPYKVHLNPFNPVPSNTYPVFSSLNNSPAPISVLDKTIFPSNVKVFEDVIITTKREKDPRLVGGENDRVLETKNLSSGYANVLQLLQSQLPGVVVTGYPPKISISIRQKRPMFMMNGNLIDIQAVSELSAVGLEKIEIIQSGAATIYGASSIVNFIYGSTSGSRPPAGISRVKYPGLYEAREFYSPRYNLPDTRHREADNRTTLLWQPVVKTDMYGRAILTFYTGDTPSIYRVIVEGITPDGSVGTATTTFSVK